VENSYEVHEYLTNRIIPDPLEASLEAKSMVGLLSVETPTLGALETFTTTPQNTAASRQSLAV
jgi:hypothetical protein